MVLIDHMHLNNLHDKQQLANRAYRSSETAVFRVYHDISAALDNGLCSVTTGLVCSILYA